MAQAGLATELTSLLGRWGAPPGDVTAVVDDVLERHREPHRRYHTTEHLSEALEVVRSLGGDMVVALAIAFHDAIYDPRRGDNEERSASLAVEQLARVGAPGDVSEEVARLVRLTAAHEVPAGDERAAQVLDADLAILGTSPDRYERYRADVRAEYGHVDDGAWATGRRAVLEGFLARDRLFLTDAARARFEEPARENLRAELATLPPA